MTPFNERLQRLVKGCRDNAQYKRNEARRHREEADDLEAQAKVLDAEAEEMDRVRVTVYGNEEVTA